MADSEIKQQGEVEKLKTDVGSAVKKLGEHDSQITNIQAITTLGFIIALITLAGVIIAFAAFVSEQVNQTNHQTLLLQQIKDKVDP